jgi:hypothetical protein
MIKPNLFIVGAPKCATTSVFYSLMQHPEIGMSTEKEPHFFGKDITSNSMYIQNLQEYLSLFSGLNGKKIIGEASPWYLYSKVAAQDIKSFSPNAKIIIMLRDPVEAVYSLYRQLCFTGVETEGGFESALLLEDKRKKGECLPKKYIFPEALFYTEVYKYSEQIERYIDTFGKESVHIVLFEDLKEGPIKTYKKIFKFLEVNQDFVITPEYKNKNKIKANSFLTWLIKIKPKFVSIFLSYLKLKIPKLKEIIKQVKNLNIKEAPVRPLTDKIKLKTYQKFKDDIFKVEQIIKINLSEWKKYEETNK